jgi:glycosyltransferase involved in cell wall biosynthesis
MLYKSNDSGVWPDVAVCIPTFNRAATVRRTVELLFSNLHYQGDISVYVGCDGDDDTEDQLKQINVNPFYRGLVIFNDRAGGIGANINRLVSNALLKHDYIVTLDDDHHLISRLTLDRHVLKLRDDLSAGRIHLLMEAQGDEHFDNYGFRATLDENHYWRVDWDSPEHFIMSFRPNITHRRWWDVMGFLPEGMKTGETEWAYARQVKERGIMGAGVNVLVPMCAYGFEHWHHNNGGVSWNRLGL